MGNKKWLILLYASVAFFLLMAATFLVMPLDMRFADYRLVNLVTGILFWCFLGLGIITQIILAVLYGKEKRKNGKKTAFGKGRIGLICFWQNLPACIADCLLVVSVMGLLIAIFLTRASGYVCYVFTATLAFSFCAHCVFNGKCYRWLTNQSAAEIKPKRVNGKEKGVTKNG